MKWSRRSASPVGVAVASYDFVDTSEGGDAIVAKGDRGFGRLDAVVSNAGIFQTPPVRGPHARRLAAHASMCTSTAPSI